MKKSALSPEPINKVGILVLSEEERKANFSNIVLYIILVLPVTKTSINKFKIVTNLAIFIFNRLENIFTTYQDTQNQIGVIFKNEVPQNRPPRP